MKTVFAAASLLLASAACQATVIGSVESPRGRIDLHDDEGACVGQALRAVYTPVQGKPVDGCWVTGGPVVMVVFFDADIARIPAAMIGAPKAA